MADRKTEDLPVFIVNIVLVLYVFLFMGFTGVLLGFHVFLTTNNTTTNEFCKDSWENIAGNPFSKTKCGRNCLKIFGS